MVRRLSEQDVGLRRRGTRDHALHRLITGHDAEGRLGVGVGEDDPVAVGRTSLRHGHEEAARRIQAGASRLSEGHGAAQDLEPLILEGQERGDGLELAGAHYDPKTRHEEAQGPPRRGRAHGDGGDGPEVLGDTEQGQERPREVACVILGGDLTPPRHQEEPVKDRDQRQIRPEVHGIRDADDAQVDEVSRATAPLEPVGRSNRSTLKIRSRSCRTRNETRASEPGSSASNAVGAHAPNTARTTVPSPH